MPTSPITTVLFDLDGTLVDTAPDLAAVLNTLLEQHGKEEQSLEAIRPYVSHGSAGMLGFGFGMGESDEGFKALRKEFLDLYADDLCHDSSLFPGMNDVLEELESRNMNWGIVTNKPGYLTEPLLDELGLSDRCCCIVSGDTLDQRKPHPAPMFHAADQAGSDPTQCVYVGDAPRDIEAGNRAGMHTLVALYGYLKADDDPDAWGATDSIDSPAGILNWIDRHG